MIKVYLKQAWELLKQNKLFSTLYIVGTGLSIAMTMVIAIVFMCGWLRFIRRVTGVVHWSSNRQK